MAGEFDNLTDASVATYANLRRQGRVVQLPGSSQWDLGYAPSVPSQWADRPRTIWEAIDQLRDQLNRATVAPRESMPLARRGEDGRRSIFAPPSIIRARFRANKNGTNQTGVTSATPVKITFGTAAINAGGYFDATNSKWIPPSGAVLIHASIGWTTANIVDAADYQTYIYKNGANVQTGAALASGTGAVQSQATFVDEANGTDYYEIFGFGGGAGDKTVDGSALLTNFEGTSI